MLVDLGHNNVWHALVIVVVFVEIKLVGIF